MAGSVIENAGGLLATDIQKHRVKAMSAEIRQRLALLVPLLLKEQEILVRWTGHEHMSGHFNFIGGGFGLFVFLVWFSFMIVLSIKFESEPGGQLEILDQETKVANVPASSSTSAATTLPSPIATNMKVGPRIDDGTISQPASPPPSP